jgi:hypothetical protein
MYSAVFVPPTELPKPLDWWRPHAVLAAIVTPGSDEDPASLPPDAIGNALKRTLPGIAVDVYWPELSRRLDPTAEPEPRVAVHLGRYHMSFDVSGLVTVSLKELPLSETTDVFDRLVTSVFPLYVLLRLVSNGEYHQLLGPGRRYGDRRLRWSFSVLGENLLGFVPSLTNMEL